MSIAKKYRQLKNLPFQKSGSIWEVVYYENDIIDVTINGCAYTDTTKGLWIGLARYYFGGNREDELKMLEMDAPDGNGEKWFEDITGQEKGFDY